MEDNVRDSAGSPVGVKRIVMWFRRTFCLHKLYVVQEFGDQTRRVACEKCKREWGMNDRIQVMVEWNDDLANMYFNLLGFKEIKPWR